MVRTLNIFQNYPNSSGGEERGGITKDSVWTFEVHIT